MKAERPARSRRPVDAAARLARALAGDAAAAGVAMRIVAHDSHGWSSATFVGERHAVTLDLGSDAAAWLAALPEAELTVRGHIVADLAVVAVDGGVRLDILTIEG